MNIAGINLAVALGVGTLLVYWYIRERHHTHPRLSESRHHPLVRRVIRLFAPLVTILLVLQLVGVVALPLPLPSGLKDTLLFVGVILFWASTIVAVWSRETLGLNWVHAADYQVLPEQQLVMWGPYRYVRHPMYLALFGVFLAVQLITASWLILLILPLFSFLVWQAKKEEALLLEAFGDVYRDYMKQAGMLWPKLRK
jgi:protein-S-isoprenylcysteine O-methyltransferase Ste14